MLRLTLLLGLAAGVKVSLRELGIVQKKFNCDTGSAFSWNPCDLKIKVCAAVVGKREQPPELNSPAWVCSSFQTLEAEHASGASSLEGAHYSDVFDFRSCFRDERCQFNLPTLKATPSDYVVTRWTIMDFDDEDGTSGSGDDLLVKDWIVNPVPATTDADRDLPPHFQECDKDADGYQFCDTIKLFFTIVPDETAPAKQTQQQQPHQSAKTPPRAVDDDAAAIPDKERPPKDEGTLATGEEGKKKDDEKVEEEDEKKPTNATKKVEVKESKIEAKSREEKPTASETKKVRLHHPRRPHQTQPPDAYANAESLSRRFAQERREQKIKEKAAAVAAAAMAAGGVEVAEERERRSAVHIDARREKGEGIE